MRVARDYFERAMYTALEFREATMGAFFDVQPQIAGLMDSATDEDQLRDELANEEMRTCLTRIAKIAHARMLAPRIGRPVLIGTEPTEPNAVVPAPASSSLPPEQVPPVPVITCTPMTPPRGVKR